MNTEIFWAFDKRYLWLLVKVCCAARMLRHVVLLSHSRQPLGLLLDKHRDLAHGTSQQLWTLHRPSQRPVYLGWALTELLEAANLVATPLATRANVTPWISG